MKRTRALVFSILMLCAAGLLGACSLIGPNTPATVKPADTSSAPTVSDSAPATDSVQTLAPASASATASTPSPSPSAASGGFQFEEKTYSEGTVTIKYPQITGMSDSASQEKLNKSISDMALRDVKTLESGTEYELNYKVTFNTPSVISLYFEGYGNVPGAAHPYQFLRTLTLDVGKQKSIALPELVRIDQAFIELMETGKYSSMSYDMTSEYESSIKEYLAGLGTDFWVNELKNADTPGHDTSTYLTPDGLVISVSVPHVMGDHVEILLSYKDLAGYQTDNLIWKEIEK